MDHILHFIYGFIATIAFSTILQTPKRALKYVGTIGGFGWVMYRYLLITYDQTLLSAMLTSILIGVSCAIIAIVIKLPTIILYLPCLIPLVPGSGMYYTMYNLIMSDMVGFAQKGIETALIAISLATGVFVSTTVVNIVNKSLINTKLKRNTKLHH